MRCVRNIGDSLGVIVNCFVRFKAYFLQNLSDFQSCKWRWSQRQVAMPVKRQQSQQEGRRGSTPRTQPNCATAAVLKNYTGNAEHGLSIQNVQTDKRSARHCCTPPVQTLEAMTETRQREGVLLPCQGEPASGCQNGGCWKHSTS